MSDKYTLSFKLAKPAQADDEVIFIDSAQVGLDGKSIVVDPAGLHSELSTVFEAVGKSITLRTPLEYSHAKHSLVVRIL